VHRRALFGGCLQTDLATKTFVLKIQINNRHCLIKSVLRANGQARSNNGVIYLQPGRPLNSSRSELAQQALNGLYAGIHRQKTWQGYHRNLFAQTYEDQQIFRSCTILNQKMG